MSLLIWIPWIPPAQDAFEKVINSQGTLLIFCSIVGIVASYTVGLALESVNQRWFDRLYRFPHLWRRRFWRQALGIPIVRFTPLLVSLRLSIEEDYEYLAGLAYPTPFYLLEFYRAIKEDKSDSQLNATLELLKAGDRQFRFSLGASLAFALVAVHSMTNFVFCLFYTLVCTNSNNRLDENFTCIVVPSLILGLGARVLGGHLSHVVELKWAQETHLTAILTRLRKPDDAE